jgi:hypothetical protein
MVLGVSVFGHLASLFWGLWQGRPSWQGVHGGAKVLTSWGQREIWEEVGAPVSFSRFTHPVNLTFFLWGPLLEGSSTISWGPSL